jgi:hypothetical protein
MYQPMIYKVDSTIKIQAAMTPSKPSLLKENIVKLYACYSPLIINDPGDMI